MPSFRHFAKKKLTRQSSFNRLRLLTFLILKKKAHREDWADTLGACTRVEGKGPFGETQILRAEQVRQPQPVVAASDA